MVDAFFPEFEDKYEGIFKNDLKISDGVYYYANGVKIRGEWGNVALSISALPVCL